MTIQSNIHPYPGNFNFTMTESDILFDTLNYERTGFISARLYRYYDQYGRWIGDRRSWRRSTFVIALNRMRHSMLPASHRTRRSREGTHLLTSFVWRSDNELTLTCCEIAGSLLIRSKIAKVAAPNLRIVGNHVHTRSPSLFNLPCLREVHGDFDLLGTRCLRAPRIKTVGGNLQVYDFRLFALASVGGRLSMRWTIRVIAPSLREVGGAIHAHVADEFSAIRLESVGGDLVMSSQTRKVRVPTLTAIGGDFWAESATYISAARLKWVGGSLVTASARYFYEPDLAFGGNWLIHPEAKSLATANRALKDVALEL